MNTPSDGTRRMPESAAQAALQAERKVSVSSVEPSPMAPNALTLKMHWSELELSKSKLFAGGSAAGETAGSDIMPLLSF